MSDDRRVIVCNYRTRNPAVSRGAKAYASFLSGSGQSLRLKAKSRGGRWVVRWERPWKLENFRFKTLPPEHPLYDDLHVNPHHTQGELERMEYWASSRDTQPPCS